MCHMDPCIEILKYSISIRLNLVIDRMQHISTPDILLVRATAAGRGLYAGTKP